MIRAETAGGDDTLRSLLRQTHNIVATLRYSKPSNGSATTTSSWRAYGGLTERDREILDRLAE
jgi:hypothetical protein